MPIGAILVIGDKIVGVAGNEIGTKNSRNAHAERILLEQFPEYRDVPDKKLYVTLEPCRKCMKSIVDFGGFSEVNYILKDTDLGGCAFHRDTLKQVGIQTNILQSNEEEYLRIIIQSLKNFGDTEDMSFYTFFFIKMIGDKIHKYESLKKMSEYPLFEKLHKQYHGL
ncbi:deaminase [Candidatus Gracilibacteria bacterium]|nr:deaminase [Candidatus Gracilibacteria bacterium]